MSTDPQALAGADRIRSLKDEDAIFQAFDSYPWRKDKAFMVSESHNTQLYLFTHTHTHTHTYIYMYPVLYIL